jgi:hypothetical protein
VLVIVSDKIINDAWRAEARQAIKKRCGIFKFTAVIVLSGAGTKTKSPRWAIDVTQAEALEILNESPDTAMRIDTLTGSDFHTCENFSGKYWHLE